MIDPIILDDLFEMGDNLSPEFHDGVIFIDDFYKNYEDIYEYLQNQSVPRWKYSSQGKNFVDYYDCRLRIGNSDFTWGEKYVKKMNFISQTLCYFFEEKATLSLATDDYEFNYFKNIKKDVPENLQHYPHRDSKYNILVYLDKICSGGTAIYSTTKNIINSEHKNLMYDIEGMDKKVIQAVPNRLVIFEGSRLHGGYIANHNQYMGENWRINQVLFADEIKH